MEPQAVLKRAARIEYAVLRTPLQIVDDRVVQRYLDENSAVRRSFERALRTLDGVVEQLLREPDGPAGSQRPSSAATESWAAEPEPRPVVEVERIDTLTEELLEQEEYENFAGELAENDDLRRIQAELKAKNLVEEQGK